MENSQNIPKTFLLALSLFSGNNRQARTFLTDKRLTSDEKKVLQGFFDLRASKFSQAIETGLSISGKSPYVKALKHLLLGCVYNNLSDYNTALGHLKIAQKELAPLNLPNFKVNCVLNLFVVFHNLRNREELDSLVKYIQTISPRNQLEEFRLLRCQFIYYSFVNDFQCASDILKRIENLSDKSILNDRSVFLVDIFNYNIKQDKYRECFEVLDEMKDIKIFYNTALFNYMKALLTYLIQDRTLYFDLNGLKKQPSLHLQMLVIKSLDENNRASAQRAWDELKKINPKHYHDNFSYSGDKCLFSISLAKAVSQSSKQVAVVEYHAPEGEGTLDTVADKILYFLKIEGNIHKEELYRKVFGQEPESKEDLQRLSKNIYKLNKKTNNQIVYHKGSYKFTG